MSFFSRFSWLTSKTFALSLGWFLAGALVTGIGVWSMESLSPTSQPRQLRQSNISTAISDYRFIDPLIGLKGVTNTQKYLGLEQQVQNLIDEEKKNGLITATVDFRDINESGGFVINPNELYTPASLLKVPVMMVYYRIADRDPSILNDRITYTGAKDSNSIEDIKSQTQLTPRASYTVEELIEHMIRHSDNNAVDMLTQHLLDTDNLTDYAAVFSDLGIDPRSLKTYSDTVTAQQYSIFLRSLYNATYLSREYSEKAMELLSEADFADGIKAGLPKNVVVAQKFGEVRVTTSSGAYIGKQLHNCGIIYYPTHPYLLCIMTKDSGNDIPSLEHFIASISQTVFEGMQKLYP